MRADGVGRETEVSMDDLVEIGVLAPGAGADPRRKLIERGRENDVFEARAGS